jgi:hypothetical protein
MIFALVGVAKNTKNAMERQIELLKEKAFL